MKNRPQDTKRRQTTEKNNTENQKPAVNPDTRTVFNLNDWNGVFLDLSQNYPAARTVLILNVMTVTRH